MDFRTIVDIAPSAWTIPACEQMLFVGSCFASNMGRRFRQQLFRAEVNPYGVMYNPASVLHTVERYLAEHEAPRVAVITLGTNHVYILKETEQIVDNCQKRPQALFREEQLTADQCADHLRAAIGLLLKARSDAHIVLTVSPIRYRKYGFHGSQLSKATLLLAIEQVMGSGYGESVAYFPSYEIVNDELRDYRFYASDMLHPSEQAVDYIYERFAETYFDDGTREFLRQWHPIRLALTHRPLNPDSAEYRQFHANALQALELLRQQYTALPSPNDIIALLNEP